MVWRSRRTRARSRGLASLLGVGGDASLRAWFCRRRFIWCEKEVCRIEFDLEWDEEIQVDRYIYTRPHMHHLFQGYPSRVLPKLRPPPSTKVLLRKQER